MSMILDGSNGVTFNDASLQGAAASPYVLKNRIINGAMVIDQRNAGASVTPTSGQYSVDRWQYDLSQASKFTAQQNAGSVTPPTGFSNYLGITSSSAYTLTSTDYFQLQQPIEGFNTADLDFGKATAKTITISFWARSSLTGNFGIWITNSATNRVYPTSYTISSANTWTYCSVTIPGDTSGTWIGATNGLGIRVVFNLGMGSTYVGGGNAWNAGTFFQPAGCVNLVATNGATLYITGVQLEQNTSATPFERRLYNQELANCQRYFNYMSGNNIHACHYGASNSLSDVWFTVPMRTTPSATYISGSVGSSFNVQDNTKGYVFQGNQGDAYINTLKLSAEL